MKLSTTDAVKRWATIVWQKRCQIFKIGPQIEYLYMEDIDTPRWIDVSEKKA